MAIRAALNRSRVAPACHCPRLAATKGSGAHARAGEEGQWLLSPLTAASDAEVARLVGSGFVSPHSSARWARAHHALRRPERVHTAAVLRHPVEALLSELLPEPQSCRLPQPSSRRSECSDAALFELRTRSMDIRLERLVRCCANPLSRTLLLTLPPSAEVESCARGECGQQLMLELSTAALLRLGFFGLQANLSATFALLRLQLGITSPAMDTPQLAEGLKRLEGWSWPSPPHRALSVGVGLRAQWREASAVDLALYRFARGVFAHRLRKAALPPPVLRSRQAPFDARAQLSASRVFDTATGDARLALLKSARAPPVHFDQESDTIVFLHIAKCGGTSFNRRLTSVDTHPPCHCRDITNATIHNGHALVVPGACVCPRGTSAELHWSPMVKTLPKGMSEQSWAFLQRQWLVSPDTTGWLGGVHAPLRVMSLYVMLAAKLTTDRPLASGVHYVSVLREPTRRFLSEFYETIDGWEAHYPTHPKVAQPCSASLPANLSHIGAEGGIDKYSKAEYDQLFPHWIACRTNMAANRQTRALAFIAGKSRAKVRERLCGSVAKGAGTAAKAACDLTLARRALRQLSFFGLNEERCKSEKLFEATFGLRFNSRRGAGVGTHEGVGTHKAKLQLSELSAQQQKRVRWLNRNDLQLYGEAVEIFHARLARYGIHDDVRCDD